MTADNRRQTAVNCWNAADHFWETTDQYARRQVTGAVHTALKLTQNIRVCDIIYGPKWAFSSISHVDNNNNNDRLTAFDPGQPG